jgi:hypothetical protein
MRSAAMSSAKDRLVYLLIAETIFVLDVAATNMQCCGLRLYIRGARKARTCRKPCQRRCQRPSCDRAMWEQSSQVQILLARTDTQPIFGST